MSSVTLDLRQQGWVREGEIHEGLLLSAPAGTAARVRAVPAGMRGWVEVPLEDLEAVAKG